MKKCTSRDNVTEFEMREAWALRTPITRENANVIRLTLLDVLERLARPNGIVFAENVTKHIECLQEALTYE